MAGASVRRRLTRQERDTQARHLYTTAVARGFEGHITRREAFRIVAAADDTNTPIGRLAALVEKECGYDNTFGHDAGSILAGLRVTKDRYQHLLRHIRAGGISNGVGYVQATFPAFLLAHLGLWRPKVNLRFGARLLDGLIKQHGHDAGLNAYNGDPTGAYGRDLARREMEYNLALHRFGS